jgi:cytochrome c oxidase assembly protein subunit 15
VLNALFAMVFMQAGVLRHACTHTVRVDTGLGIATLLYYVPVWLASVHQNGSMAVLTMAFWLTNELRRVPK